MGWPSFLRDCLCPWICTRDLHLFQCVIWEVLAALSAINPFFKDVYSKIVFSSSILSLWFFTKSPFLRGLSVGSSTPAKRVPSSATPMRLGDAQGKDEGWATFIYLWIWVGKQKMIAGFLSPCGQGCYNNYLHDCHVKVNFFLRIFTDEKLKAVNELFCFTKNNSVICDYTSNLLHFKVNAFHAHLRDPSVG